MSAKGTVSSDEQLHNASGPASTRAPSPVGKTLPVKKILRVDVRNRFVVDEEVQIIRRVYQKQRRSDGPNPYGKCVFAFWHANQFE